MNVCLPGAPGGLPQHGANIAAGVCVLAQHAAACAPAAATLLGAMDAPLGDPWAGCKDYFLAGYLPRRPGGGGGGAPL